MRRVLWIAALVVSIAPRATADAPPGHYLVLADDSVRDAKTGLTWQRTITTGVKSLEDARKVCVAPWRLPEIKELATTVDEASLALPAVDAVAFPAQPSIALWSATLSNADPEDYRSHVLNPDGTTMTVYYNGSLFGPGGVRCVQP
jgi:hypothetical protein